MQWRKLKHTIFNLSATLFLTLGIVTSNVSANPHSAWQQPHYILKAFNEIALKNEYAKTQQRIVKWQQPIRYRFRYQAIKPNPLVEQLFKMHLQHLSQITDHPIVFDNSAKANLNIYLTNDQNYANVITQHTGSKVNNLERDSNCMGTFRVDNSNAIVSANVVLPLDHVYSRGLLIACIVEETTQLMGLPNDVAWVNPTIANDDSKIELLTGLDYILLKMLYAKELKAGMHKKQSDPILRRTLNGLYELGEVENANHKVNSSGLFPLVN